MYFNPKNSEYQTCLLQFEGMQSNISYLIIVTLLDEKGELVFGFLKKDVILDSDSGKN